VRFLAHNVVYFPQLLSGDEQRDLLKDALQTLELQGNGHGTHYFSSQVGAPSQSQPRCIDLARQQHERFIREMSLGADCEFEYYLARPTTTHKLRIRSGDAVFFNGEVLSHSVSRVEANTPPWWDDIVGAIKHKHDFTRIGLQLRAST
jgi:hypothetical protein